MKLCNINLDNFEISLNELHNDKDFLIELIGVLINNLTIADIDI